MKMGHTLQLNKGPAIVDIFKRPRQFFSNNRILFYNLLKLYISFIGIPREYQPTDQVQKLSKEN